MGSIVSGLFGKGGSGIAGQGIEEAARRAESAYFKPYTVRTGTGMTSYGDGGFSTELSPEYQALLGQALTGAGGLLSQFQGFDPSQRASEIYGEQAALLQPGFEQQATALQSRLFGGGRLGLRLAGESQGLGAGSGMVQPDALGLGRAQQQTLAQLAAQSRGQALGEQAQLGQMAQGLFGIGQGISGLESQLMAQGLSAEQARAAAALGAGNLAVAPYATAAQTASSERSGMMGAVGQGIATYAALASDVRLKENIQHVDTLSNGIKVYTWEWNTTALESDIPKGITKGVMAQELLEQFPEAVLTHDSGYLTVNYLHPELQGVH